MDRHDKIGLGLLIRYHSPHKFAFPNHNLGLVIRDDLGAAQVQVLVSGNKKQWWNKEDVEVVNEAR